MVRPSRLELPTSAMSRQRSNQLSYGRTMGLECSRMRTAAILVIHTAARKCFLPRTAVNGA